MRDDWGQVRHKPQEIKITTTKTGHHLMLSLLSLLSLLSVLYLLSLSAKMSKIGDKKKKRENLLFKNGLAGSIVTSLWVVFGLSILNFKKVSKSAFFHIPVGSNPRRCFLLSNKFKHFVCFTFISGTLRNKRTSSSWQHDCVMAILFQTLCSERGKYQNNGLLKARYFSPPL